MSTPVYDGPIRPAADFHRERASYHRAIAACLALQFRRDSLARMSPEAASAAAGTAFYLDDKLVNPAEFASAPAFFFKQVGGARPKSGGKLLDGEEWCQMPRARPA